ncbi:MAG: zinc-binding dehydrogenase, partial [Myxococcota bacterium]
DRGVRVAGRTVAITGATGGVGMFAVQIARAMGARVVAQVRRAEQVEAMKALGARDVVVTEDGSALGDYGPYAIAFDGLGGVVLKNLIGMLDDHGVAVTYGGTAAYTVEFPIFGLNRTASIYGFSLYQEVDEEPGGVSLARLMRLVQDGQIKVEIGRKVSWSEVGTMAMALLSRAYPGKGVMIVD